MITIMKPLNYGIIAGLFMSLILSILSINGDYGGSALKYVKYLFFIATLIVFYLQLDPKRLGAKYFIKYISGGSKISVVAASIIALANIVLFYINPDWSIQKFNLLADSPSESMMISAVLFVEVIVLGLLCSFVVFPIFKNRYTIK